jgi:hypothetical protein
MPANDLGSYLEAESDKLFVIWPPGARRIFVATECLKGIIKKELEKKKLFFFNIKKMSDTLLL